MQGAKGAPSACPGLFPRSLEGECAAAGRQRAAWWHRRPPLTALAALPAAVLRTVATMFTARKKIVKEGGAEPSELEEQVAQVRAAGRGTAAGEQGIENCGMQRPRAPAGAGEPPPMPAAPPCGHPTGWLPAGSAVQRVAVACARARGALQPRRRRPPPGERRRRERSTVLALQPGGSAARVRWHSCCTSVPWAMRLSLEQAVAATSSSGMAHGCAAAGRAHVRCFTAAAHCCSGACRVKLGACSNPAVCQKQHAGAGSSCSSWKQRQHVGTCYMRQHGRAVQHLDSMWACVAGQPCSCHPASVAAGSAPAVSSTAEACSPVCHAKAACSTAGCRPPVPSWACASCCCCCCPTTPVPPMSTFLFAVLQALFDLEATNAELKGDLRDL